MSRALHIYDNLNKYRLFIIKFAFHFKHARTLHDTFLSRVRDCKTRRTVINQYNINSETRLFLLPFKGPELLFYFCRALDLHIGRIRRPDKGGMDIYYLRETRSIRDYSRNSDGKSAVLEFGVSL